MIGQRVDAEVRAIPYPHHATKDTRVQLMAEYDTAVDAVVAKFKESLAEIYARRLPESVQDRIWTKAWDDAHSNGYYEIEMAYEELANLVYFAVCETR